MSTSNTDAPHSEVADPAADGTRQLPPARVRTRVAPAAPASPPPPPPAAPAETPAEPSTEAADYRVGYKCPPKHTRFKKGQIANPAGRPRGAKSLSTLVDEALSAELKVTVGGRAVKMSKREAMVRQHVEKALRGDLKTFAALVKLDPKARLEADQQGEAPAQLGADELALLLAYWKATNGEEGDQ